jgi:hypothetical protein
MPAAMQQVAASRRARRVLMSMLARLSCLAVLLAFLPLVPAAAPPRGDVLEEFTFDKEGWVTLPVTIKGKSYPFIVDTGSSLSVFDEELRPLLGNSRGSVRAQTPGGETNISLFEAPLARVGRQPLTTAGSVAVSGIFRKMREVHGINVWGCLGMEFLSVHIVRIDFDRGRVALLKSAEAVTGHRLRLKRPSEQPPYVEVRLAPGKPLEWFLVNLGYVNASGALGGVRYRSLEKAGNLRHIDTAGLLTANGGNKVKVGQLDWLKIGPFEHRGLHLQQGPDGHEHSLNLSFWARYEVTFDFPGNAIYLRKGSRHAVPDVLDGSGLSILLRNGCPTVEGVVAGSPAAKANMSKGDVIVAIDRTPAGTNMFRLRKKLEGEGKTVHLVIRRGDKKREVALRLDVTWRVDQRKR